MIIKGIFDPIFSMLGGYVDSIAAESMTLPDVSSFTDIIGYSAYFFPLGTLSLILGMFFAGYTALLTWAIIEWIYKKIPGVS